MLWSLWPFVYINMAWLILARTIFCSENDVNFWLRIWIWIWIYCPNDDEIHVVPGVIQDQRAKTRTYSIDKQLNGAEYNGRKLHLGADITRSNMAWYCMYKYSGWSRMSIRMFIFKGHPISPYNWNKHAINYTSSNIVKYALLFYKIIQCAVKHHVEWKVT